VHRNAALLRGPRSETLQLVIVNLGTTSYVGQSYYTRSTYRSKLALTPFARSRRFKIE
jgi:hypothetical protein